jgi:hypothetical protein
MRILAIMMTLLICVALSPPQRICVPSTRPRGSMGGFGAYSRQERLSAEQWRMLGRLSPILNTTCGLFGQKSSTNGYSTNEVSGQHRAAGNRI